jgi:hypothetical protein
MPSIDVNLSPASLDVYGGPASIDLALDYGAQGQRGSKIWVGSGNPVQQLSGQDVKVGDFFINTLQGADFYGWLYAYVESVSGPAWELALRLSPQQISTIVTRSFNSSGIATIDVPVSDITKDLTVIKDQFTIRYNIENSAPIASSFEYDIVRVPAVTGPQFLRITVSATKYSGSAWSSLTGNNKIHLFISYLK